MNENIRKNLFCVISKEAHGDYAAHDVQTNSGWTENPYGEGYAVVPDEIVQEVVATHGFCDIVLNEEGTELVSFTAREIPVIEEPEQPISETERLRADIDYIAALKGVVL